MIQWANHATTEHVSRITLKKTRTPATDQTFASYPLLPKTWDEFFAAPGQARASVEQITTALDALGIAELQSQQRVATEAFLTGGITFNVYSNAEATERIFPFDVIPRVVPAADWEIVDRGLRQRVTALNAFLADVYSDQRIFKDGRIPREVLETSAGYLPTVQGIRPRGGVYVQVAGIDLVRAAGGRFLVLEDNLRTPSGVSYVLENRAVMKRVLGALMARARVCSVDEYASRLRRAIQSLSVADTQSDGEPRTVVLSPGPYNAAYFEHSYLARRMGVDLVLPADLFVHDGFVFMKTTAGPQRVDAIYRRIDDEFIDPTVFREDSLLGVPGVFDVYAKGNVTLTNAIGNGVADDKAMYPYVPDMIRFYLSEEPILDQVETYRCQHDAHRDHVLANLSSMVVKEVNGSGGYGMLMGPSASREQLDEFAGRIRAKPRNYIAQPLIELSSCPTVVGGEVVPRRVDLRPFIITGRSTWVLPGGLTRVALSEGSYVVNSSQGGGSKDTWVLEAKP